MKRMLTFVLILIVLFPVCSSAAYRIYLKNGSEISGVNSYEEKGGKVNIYFSTGSMMIPKKDILKIEGKESPVEETAPEEKPEAEQGREPTVETTEPPVPAPEGDKRARINELRAELDSVTTEIRAVEEQEAKLVATINEKTGRKFSYNLIQLRQLEKELEPVRQELGAVQQQKAELLGRRNSIEAELKSLE